MKSIRCPHCSCRVPIPEPQDRSVVTTPMEPDPRYGVPALEPKPPVIPGANAPHFVTWMQAGSVQEPTDTGRGFIGIIHGGTGLP